MTRAIWVSLVIGVLTLAISGHADAQGNGRSGGPPVGGNGTPGTVPLWTGSGSTLADSHVRDNGGEVIVTLPLQVSASSDANGVSGYSPDGAGVAGQSENSYGVVGFTNATSNGIAGVLGGGSQYGVVGFATADGSPDGAWGVKGSVTGINAVGVEGHGPSVGVRGQALSCSNTGCTPTAGDAGQFLAGAGGNLLIGFEIDANNDWLERFKVGANGDSSIVGNAFKPSGGSWSTLSDRRAKKSIEPISGALNQLLNLRGVTFEYANPFMLGELPGTKLGMVAQDVETVFPSWVDEGADGYKRLTFRGFEALTVEAVRELDTRVRTSTDDAIARIEALEKQNTELRRQIEGLTETLRSLQTAR